METIEILGITHDVSNIIEKLSPYGNPKNGLRKSRPDENGLVQYVWRYARFHSGQDTHMPTTCEFWLKDYFETEHGMQINYLSDMSQASKEIDPLVKYVCEQFGLDDTKAAQRWGRAGLV